MEEANVGLDSSREMSCKVLPPGEGAVVQGRVSGSQGNCLTSRSLELGSGLRSCEAWVSLRGSSSARWGFSDLPHRVITRVEVDDASASTLAAACLAPSFLDVPGTY